MQPFFVECYVMLSLTFHRLAIGVVLAYPAVLTPALVNSTYVTATKEEASWIAAAYSTTGPLGFFIISPIMQKYGRRYTNILLNLTVLIGWIIIALASNVPTLIFGRAFQGLAIVGIYINSMTAAEYSHPKRRGFFIVFKTAATCIGVLLCHSLGFTFTWKQMAWLGAIPPTLDAILTLYWPESPSWLAYKGRYEECMSAFIRLRGQDANAKDELRELIRTQQKLSNLKKVEKVNDLVKLKHAFTSKDFLKPLIIVFLLTIMAHACGVHYMLAYVIDIMVKLSADTSKAFYYTLGLDAVKTIGIIISSIVVRMFNRRILLFVTGVMACTLLGSICVVHYLVKINILEVSFLTPSLLILYNFVCHIGIIPLSLVLIGELIPIEYKGIGICVVGIIYSVLSVLTLKLTPVMLDSLNVHGAFIIYLTIMVCCLISLFFILPETKDRTLQDIELVFINHKLNIDVPDKETELTYKFVK